MGHPRACTWCRQPPAGSWLRSLGIAATLRTSRSASSLSALASQTPERLEEPHPLSCPLPHTRQPEAAEKSQVLIILVDAQMKTHLIVEEDVVVQLSLHRPLTTVQKSCRLIPLAYISNLMLLMIWSYFEPCVALVKCTVVSKLLTKASPRVWAAPCDFCPRGPWWRAASPPPPPARCSGWQRWRGSRACPSGRWGRI